MRHRLGSWSVAIVTLGVLAGSVGLVQGAAAADPPAATRKPVCTDADPTPPTTASGHADDDVPDPEGRIVFGRFTREDHVKGQIVSLHAIDPDGSDMRPLLDCDTARPRFSPDGRRIAFAIVMDDGPFQVATMAADGTDLRILTDTPGYAETPDWSPDGSWLVYSFAPKPCVDFDPCVLEDGNLWNLWRMNADGSDQRLIGNPGTFDWEPRISPNGRDVVFQRTDPAKDWATSLVIRDLSTDEERAVIEDDRPLEHPDWSPDGRSIIYNPTGCSACERIELMPADDPKATPLVLYPGDETHHGFKPVYSPDGSRIAFGCVPGMCLMDADGSNVVTIATTVGDAEVNHFDWGVVPPGTR